MHFLPSNSAKEVDDLKRTVLAMVNEDYDSAIRQGIPEISQENVELEFVREEQRRGSFTVTDNSANGISGFVFSTDARMKVLTPDFSGKECEIEYEFDSVGMEAGDTVEGLFQIISNKGEYSVSFNVKMDKEYPYSSLGQIKNLFHFANLAKTDWEEALALYYSNQFINVLDEGDVQYRNIYRGLSCEPGNPGDMDEFLVAAKKKSRIIYDAGDGEIILKDVKERTKREIKVTASTWGYYSLNVSSGNEFVDLSKTEYGNEDFLGNVCNVEFYINPGRLHLGRNIDTVTITTPFGDIQIKIVILNSFTDVSSSEEHLWKKLNAELTHDYIKFRLGKTELDEWCKTSENRLSRISVTGEHKTIAELYQAQLLLAQGRIQDAKWVLENLQYEIGEDRSDDEIYAYYIYLNTLVYKDAETINKTAHKVRKMYSRNSESFRLAWLMLFLQEELLNRNEKRWDFLKEQYRLGNDSPILYVEAIQILKKNPSLLTELGDFETAILDFACKEKTLTLELGERIQFLIGREKNFNPLFFKIMDMCYKQNPTREMLQAICSYLMKGNCIGEKFIPWYEEAIRKDLRITRLYEYYMYSLPENYKGEIPKMVLMYFAYQNDLDYKKVSFLYRYVFENSYRFPEIAASYEERVESFIREQLAKGRADKALMYLYRRFVNVDMLDTKLAHDLTPMLFMCEVKAPSPDYTKAVLIYDRIIGEAVYPIKEGVAYMPIYCDDYTIMFENAAGTRFHSDSLLKPDYLFHDEILLSDVQLLVGDRIGLIMNTCCPGGKEFQITEANVFGFERMIESEKLTTTFKKDVLTKLVNFYFDNDQIRKLDEFMLGVKPEMLDADQRGECIHVLISRGLYDTAYLWTKRFGPEYVQPGILLRLCSRLLERRDFEEDEGLIELCSYVYRRGKYDQNILAYMASYYNADTKELRQLYKTVESFGVEGYVLLERLLVQILFTGAFCSEGKELFDKYVHSNGSTTVMKAFLANASYDYFVSEGIVDVSIFESVEKFCREGEDLNRITRLALLKYYADHEEVQRDEAIVRDFVRREMKAGAIFPFFKSFTDIVPELIRFSDHYFVEYRGNPGSRVIMHYSIEHDNGRETEYRKEEMDNLYGGIFIKDFILFCGESIQYYITEEDLNREQLTQSSVLSCTEKELSHGDWRYSLLNDAVISRDMQDYDTAAEIIFEYLQNDYLVNRIFTLE